MKEYIYTLSDPRDSRVRYVGRTLDPDTRQVCHRVLHRTDNKFYGRNSQLQKWVAELRALDLCPVFAIVEECDGIHAATMESAWVSYHVGVGDDLLNIKVKFIPNEHNTLDYAADALRLSLLRLYAHLCRPGATADMTADEVLSLALRLDRHSERHKQTIRVPPKGDL